MTRNGACRNTTTARCYEKLMLDGFQAGLSWITILRKRDNFRRAFDDFEPEKIARYTPRKIERLMQDAGIVRNRAKIEGAVALGARLSRDHGEGPGLFGAALGPPRRQAEAEHVPHARNRCRRRPTLSRKMSKELVGRGFKFVGPTIVYAFMQAVGMVNDHLRHLPPPRRLRQARQKAMSKMQQGRPTARKTAPRAWQRMLSGRRLDLLDPSPLDVEIEDIAHGLARVARWNGQTKGAHIFSVAQHALLVEALARAKVPRLDRSGRLAVLLHDAPEYVIGDMISPFKAVIGDSYKAVEKRLLAAIHLRFGLPAKLPENLHNADQGRRPHRRLSRSDAARRLCRRRGAEILRPAAEIFRRARARLSHALAGRDRRQARYRERFEKLATRVSLFIRCCSVIDMTQAIAY